MILFKAVGYHGTTKDTVKSFLEEDGIDCSYKRGQEPFLGGGLYLWRDSYQRALKWSKNHAGNVLANQAVLEVNLECQSQEMFNFTSTEWNNEQVVIKAYLKAIEALKESGSSVFYFGHFLDSLITNQTDIKLVTMHDLTDKMHIFNIQSPEDREKETNFAFGDIQLCIKDASIITSKKEITV